MAKSTAYLGNPNLKKSNVHHDWTKEMIVEYQKCASDPIYFIEKYMKIIHVDRGLINFKLYDYQKDMILSMQHNRNTIINTARQIGKMLFLDHPLPLFNGKFTTMGDIKVGDILIDAEGNPTKVTFKSSIQTRNSYRITFDDKTTCDTGDEHQWEVFDRFEGQKHKPHKQQILTTKYMYENGWFKTNSRGYKEYRWYIPNTKPVNYQKKEQKIDPYILGLWLGDGTSANRNLTCSADDVEHYKNQGVDFGYQIVVKNKPNIFTATLNQLTNKDLNFYNLRNNKHIPEDYLYGSIEQRIALVQGLFDTDGFIEKTGLCCIQLSEKNNILIDQIYQLLCSLGLKVFHSKHTDKKQNKNSIRLAFMCDKNHFQVAKIKRKNNRQKENCQNSRYSLSRTIQNIEVIEPKPAQCITVDNDRHLYLCSKNYLPTHNSTCTIGFILWYTLFTPDKDVALLANKGDTAREILGKYHLAYQYLPKFLQQGTIESNKGTIELENNSRIIATSSSSDAIRGYAIALLFIDEMAFLENWEAFSASTLPTITSGQTTKTVFVSTPNGLNHFYKYWQGANRKDDKWNGYNPIKVTWDKVPGRDKKWKQETIQLLNGDLQKFSQENEAEFLGSSGTLISGAALKNLVDMDPIIHNQHKNINMYYKPIKDHLYMVIVDTSEGKGLDYSAFSVIDITQTPYQQVCSFKNNKIAPGDYAQIVFQIAKTYNTAYILVENNNIGYEVARALRDDLEYEMMLYSRNNGAGGKILASGFGDKTNELGIKTSKSVKQTGCSMLKLLIEGQQLITNDYDTHHELNRFSKKGSSYEAESGEHDDLVMTLVLFAWASKEKYFQELTDINTLQKVRDEFNEQIEDQLIPFISTSQYPDLDEGVVIAVNNDKWLSFDEDQPQAFRQNQPRYAQRHW